MSKIENVSQLKIIDITRLGEYDISTSVCRLCLLGSIEKDKNVHRKPFREGFTRNSIFDGEAVGATKYALADASDYSIRDDDVIVVNCVSIEEVKGTQFRETTQKRNGQE